VRLAARSVPGNTRCARAALRFHARIAGGRRAQPGSLAAYPALGLAASRFVFLMALRIPFPFPVRTGSPAHGARVAREPLHNADISTALIVQEVIRRVVDGSVRWGVVSPGLCARGTVPELATVMSAPLRFALATASRHPRCEARIAHRSRPGVAAGRADALRAVARSHPLIVLARRYAPATNGNARSARRVAEASRGVSMNPQVVSWNGVRHDVLSFLRAPKTNDFGRKARRVAETSHRVSTILRVERWRNVHHVRPAVRPIDTPVARIVMVSRQADFASEQRPNTLRSQATQHGSSRMLFRSTEAEPSRTVPAAYSHASDYHSMPRRRVHSDRTAAGLSWRSSGARNAFAEKDEKEAASDVNGGGPLSVRYRNAVNSAGGTSSPAWSGTPWRGEVARLRDPARATGARTGVLRRAVPIAVRSTTPTLQLEARNARWMPLIGRGRQVRQVHTSAVRPSHAPALLPAATATHKRAERVLLRNARASQPLQMPMQSSGDEHHFDSTHHIEPMHIAHYGAQPPIRFSYRRFVSPNASSDAPRSAFASESTSFRQVSNARRPPDAPESAPSAPSEWLASPPTGRALEQFRRVLAPVVRDTVRAPEFLSFLTDRIKTSLDRAARIERYRLGR
jgi:hypothetical protein